MTDIGAVMDPGAGGVDCAMLVERPDAAGGHLDTSGGMTCKAAEVASIARFTVKCQFVIVGRMRLLSVRVFY